MYRPVAFTKKAKRKDRPPTASEQAALDRVWKAVSEAREQVLALVAALGQIWVCPKCGGEFSHEDANSMNREHAECDAWLERAAPDPEPPREGRAFGPTGEHDDTITPSDVDNLLRRGRRAGRDPWIPPSPKVQQDGEMLIDEGNISGPPGGRLNGVRLPARKAKRGAMIDFRRVD